MTGPEPDLRARITQAIRDEAETHSCLYQEGIDVDEMVHRVMAAIDGEQPPVAVTITPEITTLTAKRMTALAPACPSGRHVDHPGYDCDEQDALAEAWERTWGKWLAADRKAQSDYYGRVMRWGQIGPALRGPNYPAPAPDPAPLRAIAEQALGMPEPGAVRRDPRADDPAYDPITGYRNWAEVDANPPQFTGLLSPIRLAEETS